MFIDLSITKAHKEKQNSNYITSCSINSISLSVGGPVSVIIFNMLATLTGCFPKEHNSLSPAALKMYNTETYVLQMQQPPVPHGHNLWSWGLSLNYPSTSIMDIGLTLAKKALPYARSVIFWSRYTLGSTQDRFWKGRLKYRQINKRQ